MKLPLWDKDTLKLNEHYSEECVKTFISYLDAVTEDRKKIDHSFKFNTTDINDFILSMARKMGLFPRSIKEVPFPIRLWSKRIFKLYINKEIRKAFEAGKLSARFSLDLVDYAHKPQHMPSIKLALQGKLTNLQFRKTLRINNVTSSARSK